MSGVPVIVLATQMDVYDKTVSNLQEVKAREAVVIAIGFEGDTSLAKYADHVIYIPKTDKYLAPLPTRFSSATKASAAACMDTTGS